MAKSCRYVAFVQRPGSSQCNLILIIQLKILNQTMVVVNSGPAVKEILDKQGALSGNRPQAYLIKRAEGEYPLFSNLGE